MSDPAVDADIHPITAFIAAMQLGDPQFGITAFCDQCGISRGAYYRLMRGSEDVGNALFEKIELGTRHVLKAQTLYDAWLKAKRERLASTPATDPVSAA